jgi:hypothetical protein
MIFSQVVGVCGAILDIGLVWWSYFLRAASLLLGGHFYCTRYIHPFSLLMLYIYCNLHESESVYVLALSNFRRIVSNED